MRTREEIIEDLDYYRERRDDEGYLSRLTPTEIDDLDQNIKDCERELSELK